MEAFKIRILKQDMDSTEVNETSRNGKASNGKNPTLFLLFPG
jgi:hypothetical protein